jgi:hypothetical protein
MTPPLIFLSYASEDKEFAEQISEALRTIGVNSWFAPGELKPGDSIVERINNAMDSIRFSLLIISKPFLLKAWPLREFHALTALGIKNKERRLIPILHGVSDHEFLKAAPMMADIKWISSERGLDSILCSLRVVLAEPGNQALPHQQVVVEESGRVVRYDTLETALEQAQNGAMVVVYPGEYIAPSEVNKSVSIVARGSARDTIVRIPINETLRIEASDFELDGVTILPGTESNPKRRDYELFLTGAPYPRVIRGDSMLAVSRSEQIGRLLLKNCVIDAMDRFSLILATDARVQIRNSTLKHSERGITVRNGGNVELAACTLQNVNIEAVGHGSLLISECSAHECQITSLFNGHIQVEKSEFVDSTVHAYSESRISVSNHCNFKQVISKGSTSPNFLYATQYSYIRAEDSEFAGASIAIYVHGGSLLSARRLIIRRTQSCGIRYSEGCSGDIEDSRIIDCLGEGIRVQKGANPVIRHCTIEANEGVGISSEMSANLNIEACHIYRNRQGGITVDANSVRVLGTRVFLNDGPGISIRGASRLEIIGCEIGQNAHGQLLIGGVQWYPPQNFREKLSDWFAKRRNIKIIDTTLY